MYRHTTAMECIGKGYPVVFSDRSFMKFIQLSTEFSLEDGKYTSTGPVELYCDDL